MTWLAVGIGGALGSLARHAVNQLSRGAATRFPVGTVTVNLVGCFAIGVLAGLLASERIALGRHWREFIFVGVLGGFTTFSTFGLDAFTLVQAGAHREAIASVAVHVIGGLAAVWVGYVLAIQ